MFCISTATSLASIFFKESVYLPPIFDYQNSNPIMQQPTMDDWQLEFDWLRIRHRVKDSVNSKDLPDIKAILFLIGLQEYGNFTNQRSFTKEEKQDLMHIAVCSLLEGDGYYEYVGRDHDGWPHWNSLKPFVIKGSSEQEKILKEKIINYFDI